MNRHVNTPKKIISFSSILLLLFGICFNEKVNAQIIINYPTASQAITRGLDTSLLTVRITFSSACTGNTATISLPAGVTYIPASIIKTGGTGSFSITDLGGTANNPTFSIGGVTSPGYIDFTIKRAAGCGIAASGKDAISVTGSCGTITENDINTNTYNLYSPALSVTPPSAIASALIGNNYTRNITITNGGNGCLDTLHYYVVYISGGIASTNASNAITANGVDFIPSSTNGDTLFYKILGTTVFGADGLLCNGETVTITENIKIVKCNGSTIYRAGWGKSQNNLCQTGSGGGTVTMANGVANISATFTRIQEVNWCRQGIFTLTYTNSGNGGNAGTAYNVLPNIGYNTNNNEMPPVGLNNKILTRIDSIKMGAITVPLIPLTVSAPVKANFSTFASDPDGTGVGLADLDGDGQFDDLAPGKSITLTVYEHWIDNSINCPAIIYHIFNSHTVSYTNMCGAVATTNPLAASGGYRLATVLPSIIMPAQVSGGIPFTIQICVNLASLLQPVYKPNDSLYFDITLPAGTSLNGTGNMTYNGASLVAAYGDYYTTTSGSITVLHVKRKAVDDSYCFTADFVYDCAAGLPNLSFGINNYYKGDTCSASIEKYLCTTATVKARCPGCTTDGIINIQPTATRLSLGYTDKTLTTKVSPASVIGVAKYTGLPLDTFSIIVPGKQVANLGSFNNLHYNLQFGKASSQNVFQFISGTVNIVRGGVITTTTLAAPVTSGTGSLQKMYWNLTANLTAGTILNGDSVWLDLRFVITQANSGQLYSISITQVPDISSTLYNINSANIAVACDTAQAMSLLLSGIKPNPTNNTPAVTVTNCNATNTLSNQYLGTANGYDIFPDEYRPLDIIDSVLITLPVSYELSPATNSINTKYWSNQVTWKNISTSTNGIVQQRGANSWIIKNPYLFSGGWDLADLGPSSNGSYLLSYNIAPTCASVSGIQNYTVNWYFRRNIYAGTSNYINQTSSESSTISYNQLVKPSLALQNNTGTVMGTLPQHYWDVQINSTGAATAPYVWMALDRTGSGISIDSVVYAGSNIPQIVYAPNKTWYKLTTAGIAGGSNVMARVYFKYTSCTTDSILASASWNCTSYPGNPDAALCTASTLYLKLAPQASQVQIAVSRQPGNGGNIDLCTQDSVTVIVNSAQSGNLLNPVLHIYSPTGTTLTSPVPVEYPVGSGIWQNVPLSVITGGYSVELNNVTTIGVNGLPGTVSSPSSASRQAKLKIAFSADCSFASGGPLDFYVYGNSPCGTAAAGNGAEVLSNPININGAPPVPDHYNTITMSNPTFNCSNITAAGAVTLTAGIYNLGPSASPINEKVILNLPAGYKYVPASVIAPYTNEIITTNPDGSQRILWDFPVAIAAGTSLTISPKLYLDVSLIANCTSMPVNINLQTGFASAMNCGASTCPGFVKQNGNATATASINLPNVTPIVAYSYAIYNSSTHNWKWDINGTLLNTGSPITAGTSTTTEFVCDANNSGVFDAGDYIVGNFTTTNAIATGANVPFAYTGTFASTYCNPVNAQAGFFILARRNPDSAPAQCLCAMQKAGTFVSVLPIKLQSFTVIAKEKTALLTWSIRGENKNTYTEIEYSTDGIHFTTIGRINAKENVGSVSTYTFTDKQIASANNYYRLKITDESGHSAYSDIQLVNANRNQNQHFIALPNPVTNHLFISGGNINSIQEIRITDMAGKVIYRTKDIKNQLDMTKYSAAIYMLQIVKADGSVQAERIIKQ